ncbi:Hpt domain-containing protein [Desulfobulbus oligotrophicus]|jgi:HPt (histidine-containing phosphotransfer) domain-containing protein|uniref:Hpt domain-containing protein n=1 Tax=Desulfobulbus oligotrophicus TaxID=1909699 RepID=A0A7T6AR69_9BACT|nr:Hpt domain-containing protein [Desulfobulbus oligotrophicus]MDY0391053.1 Hpt domain-containing protein [Desulfobulbus oligotrophicus]QQG66230.1 Hpt domain-containing protein [Desulfobulbus oligotrophicus]
MSNNLQWNKTFALEQTAGNEELLEELLVLFKNSAAADYILLQEGVKKNNPEVVMHAAHSIKGAASSLGIEGIRQLAHAMEIDSRNNSVVVARDTLPAMAELMTQLQVL